MTDGRAAEHDEPTGHSLPRPPHRQYFAMIIIGASVALALGHTLRQPSLFEANDISRWCTVWSLVEQGSYAIDDCPWQSRTQDKVKKPDKLSPPTDATGPLRRIEYALAPARWKEGEPVERFYSSKPPLLPTIIAGLIYPFRVASGVPLDRVVDQLREPRYVQKETLDRAGQPEFVLETPDPMKWPAYVFYFKPIVLLLNTLPVWLMLVLYARHLDREADDDWCWLLCLATAGMGTYLFTFNQTLNNHTVAAWSTFFALVSSRTIWEGTARSAWPFAFSGFFAAFASCNEIPAGLFGLLLFIGLLRRSPGRTLAAFLPAAAVPLAGFFCTQFLAFGQFTPVYEEFGTKSYNYEGSYWNTPLEMDWFNKNPEPTLTYLFHMTLGHHGVFSLSPIFLFSIGGALREILRRGRFSAVAWLTLILTASIIAFYAWNPKARNYGGSTQGLRWLFWLIPFWLWTLPAGVSRGSENRLVRGLTLLAFLVSVTSVGYALRTPWSHPWILDALEHLDLYTLKR